MDGWRGSPDTNTDPDGWNRRRLLGSIGAVAGGALAGCIERTPDRGTTAPVDGTASAFVTALVPTVAVRTRGGSDAWQPRRVVTTLGGGRFGWQLATKQRPEVVDSEGCDGEVDRHTVPCRIVIGGESGAASRLSAVTLSTYGTCSTLTTGLPPNPPEVGAYELPVAMVHDSPQTTDNSRGFSVGGVELGVRPREGGSRPTGGGLLTASAPATPVGDPADRTAFGGEYSVVRKTGERLGQALREGYERLTQLLTFTQIVYGAGVATVAAGGRLLVTYGKEVATDLATEGAKAGLLYVERALTAEGARVPSADRLRRARLAEGTAFFPPRTDAERRAFSLDSIGTGSYGYGAHEKGTGEVVDVGLGFSGPFVSLVPSPDERETPTVGLPGTVPAERLSDGWEDGTLRSPPWRAGDGVEVVEEPAPDGGSHSLRLFSNERRRRVTLDDGLRWDAPWTVNGMLRVVTGEGGPPGYRLAHNVSLVGGRVALRFEGPSPNEPLLRAKLTDSELADGTDQTTVGWADERWFEYEVRHDGSGTYRLKLWGTDGDEPDAYDRACGGTPPDDGEYPLGYFAYSGDPQAVHHAYVDYRTDAATG